MKLKMNVPTILTFFRILLVPVAVVFVCDERMRLGLVVYVIACLTDILDGIIARRYQMITDAGKFLDPLADKIMAISLVITFTMLKVLPWFICVFIVVKELILIGGGLILYKNKIVVSANIFGKLSAVLFNTAIGFTFLYDIASKTYMILMYIAMVFALASVIQYYCLNTKKYIDFKKEKIDIDVVSAGEMSDQIL